MPNDDYFLGDTGIARGIAVPRCNECGNHMNPVVIFGYTARWYCPVCSHTIKKWTKNTDAKR